MLTKFGKGRHRGIKKSGNTGIVPSFIPDSFSNYISDTGKLQILYLCSLQSKLKLKKGGGRGGGRGAKSCKNFLVPGQLYF